jgi:hypothetical protein
MTNSRKPTNAETLEGQLAVSEDGRRHLNLNQGEREVLARQRQIEAAVALFLDLETDRTWAEIAGELDISVSSLKRLSQSSDFLLVYEDALATIGHDPRLQAVTSSLGDLLPAARRRLQQLITNNDTPDGVALKAIERLFQWTGADSKIETDNPEALKNFLQQNNVTVEGNMTVINIPDEYQNAFQRFLGGSTDIVEGETRTPDNGDPSRISEQDPGDSSPGGGPSDEEAPPEP